MRFLVAFLAVVGYASARVISPLILGVNPGDAQAAAIDARAAIRDYAQAWTDAARLSHDVSRNINENVYWNNVAANQNVVAIAQRQAAVLNAAAVTGRRGVVAPLAISPINIGAPLGIGSPITIKSINGQITPYGLGPLGLGLHAW